MDLVAEYWQVFLTIIIVILALLVVYLVARRWGRRIGSGGARLAVTEVQDIDQARRLVLVRRDGVEHLLLVGGGQDVVVETNISRRGPARTDEPPAFGRDHPAPEPYHAPEPAMSRATPAPGREPPLFSGREPRQGPDMAPPDPPPAPAERGRDYAEENERYYEPDPRLTRRDDDERP